MKYKLHIPYKNRPDLTLDSIKSNADIGNIHLWPNGDAPDLPDLPAGVTVRRLPEMSPVDVINMMIQSSWDDDVMFWAHNDCFSQPGAAKEFFDIVEAAHHGSERWGVYFSLYDILCAFNMEAVREVGYWDPMFFQYTADPDYYHRMAVHNWPIKQWAEGRDGRIIHRGSMTVRSDPTFNRRVQWRERTKFDKSYYAMKWGGLPGTETFKKPFEHFK
jgi:hypothetical protein